VRSGLLTQRLLALVAVHLTLILGLFLVRQIVDLPSGFGSSQFSNSAELQALSTDRLLELRDGVDQDLTRFIPGYLVVGLAAIAVAVSIRSFQRTRDLVTVVALLLVLGVLADVFETILFARSLDQALTGPTASSLAVQATRVFFVVKWVALVLSYLVLLVLVLRPGPTRGS